MSSPKFRIYKNGDVSFEGELLWGDIPWARITGAPAMELGVHDNTMHVDPFAKETITLTAGSGLSGGGTLADHRVFSLGTPGTLTGLTENEVSAASHTHKISLAWEHILGKPVTFPPATHNNDAHTINFTPESRTITGGNGLTGGGTLTENRTLHMGTPSTLSGDTSNSVSNDTHEHKIETTTARNRDRTDELLVAKALFDHTRSTAGDHDARYLRSNAARLTIGPVPPENPSVNDIWIDTSAE